MVTVYAGIDTTTRTRNLKLTDAEIKALPATPVTVIPAPGLGRAIVLDRVFLTSSIAPAGGYTALHVDGNLQLRYADGGYCGVGDLGDDAADSITNLTDFLTASKAATLESLTQFSADWNSEVPYIMNPAAHPNTAVRFLHTGGDNAPFTGGNAANFIVLRMRYWIVRLV